MNCSEKINTNEQPTCKDHRTYDPEFKDPSCKISEFSNAEGPEDPDNSC